MSKDSAVKISETAIRWGFILLFFLVPLIFTPYNYELFEYNKMMTTYGLTAIILGAYIIKSISSGRFEIRRTPFDIPLILFVLSQILATIFSIDRHTSLFGYYSRFHGGLLSTISYVFLFYIFASMFSKNTSFVYRLISTSFVSALLVAFYAILQKLGVDKTIWVQDVQNRVFSTLGQPNWLSAYFSIIVIIALSLFLKEKLWKKYLYLFYAILFYTVIIFTKSRSGFVGLWVGIAFLALLTVLFNSFFKNVKPFCLAVLLLVISSFFFGTPFSKLTPYTFGGIKTRPTSSPSSQVTNGSMIEFGGTESGSIRKIVWTGAIDIFRHYPLFGSGVETFAYSYYQFRPQQHNLTSEWDFLYNRAHNEYLNFAANSGIVGLSAYLLLIVSFLIFAVKKIRQNPPEKMLLTGLLASYASILFSNFFGFSVVIIGIFFFLIPAFAFVLTNEDTKVKRLTVSFFQEKNHLSNVQKGSIFALLLVICYLLFVLVQMWRADKSFNLGHQLVRINQYVPAYNALKTAVTLDPNEPTFKDELASVESTLAVVAKANKEEAVAQKLQNEALDISYKLTTDYPKNVNFWKTRTRILYTLSDLDQTLLQQALQAILKAWTLAPNDPKIAYNAGLLYAKAGDTNKAIDTLKYASSLKPDYYEPRWALVLFYEQIGEKDKAKEETQFILKNIRPDDKDAREKLKELSK